jgi:ribosomal protein S18 acetylase RimI-like enzyme
VHVTTADPRAPQSLAILTDYWREIVHRFYDRAPTDAHVREVLDEFGSDDLVAPTGVFLLAVDEEDVVGCAGLYWTNADEAELRRMYIAPRGRRRGWARVLLDAAEREAVAAGRTAILAEVRGDLVEAQALYESHGYERVPAFSNASYADVWLRKPLAGAAR